MTNRSLARQKLSRWQMDMWPRHANPWSVYTRFAAIPAMIAAIWSREWLGWWALTPVVAVLLWLIANPFVFSPVGPSRSWASKGIYGEQLWLTDRARVGAGHRWVLRWLIAAGLAGFMFLAWGLWSLHIWPTLEGTTLLVMAQLWRIDRMGLLFDEMQRRPLEGSEGGGAHD